jgi:hypothetical protein
MVDVKIGTILILQESILSSELEEKTTSAFGDVWHYLNSWMNPEWVRKIASLKEQKQLNCALNIVKIREKNYMERYF